MRISDWSSDVCSSDLERRRELPAMSSLPAESVRPGLAGARRLVVKIGSALLVDEAAGSIRRDWLDALSDDVAALMRRGTERSEARRVGKEWCSTFRSRGSPYI